jgi:hypothetical protein
MHNIQNEQQHELEQLLQPLGRPYAPEFIFL